jgi:hypothetical protein
MLEFLRWFPRLAPINVWVNCPNPWQVASEPTPFVVAPNLISADKRSRKSAESAVQGVLRGHEPCEIGRAGAYLNHLSLNCKRRRTRWRMLQSIANHSLPLKIP